MVETIRLQWTTIPPTIEDYGKIFVAKRVIKDAETFFLVGKISYSTEKDVFLVPSLGQGPAWHVSAFNEFYGPLPD